uniref:Uncharacterized protein n=1 Tax=Oryza nivara TaxID=4536 RepID=A0A0E0IXD6_ORYNI
MGCVDNIWIGYAISPAWQKVLANCSFSRSATNIHSQGVLPLRSVRLRRGDIFKTQEHLHVEQQDISGQFISSWQHVKKLIAILNDD